MMRKLSAMIAATVAAVALTSCATDDPAARESQTRQAAEDACANITVDTPPKVVSRCKAAAAGEGEARVRNRATGYPEAKTTAEQEYLAAIEIDSGAAATGAKLSRFQRELNLRIGRAVCTLYKNGHPDYPRKTFTARDAADALVLEFDQDPFDAKQYVERYIPVLCPDEARLAGKVGKFRPMS